jgi:transcriptional regulator with XRE-family HTH domain
VRRHRADRSLTQEQLAELAGLDRKTISRVENGHYSPSLDNVWALADALNVEAYSLLIPNRQGGRR